MQPAGALLSPAGEVSIIPAGPDAAAGEAAQLDALRAALEGGLTALLARHGGPLVDALAGDAGSGGAPLPVRPPPTFRPPSPPTKNRPPARPCICPVSPALCQLSSPGLSAYFPTVRKTPECKS